MIALSYPKASRARGRRGAGVEGRHRARPGIEPLEGRALLSLSYSHTLVPDLSDQTPPALTVGGDGNLWFAQRPHVPPYPQALWGPYAIGKVTPDGVSTRFVLPNDGTYPESIAAGPDGNVWFTEGNNMLDSRRIARITPSGVITSFPLPHGSYPGAGELASGPGGALWVVADNGIDRVSTSGVVTNFPLFSALSGDYIEGVTAGPDGNVWFAGDLGKGSVIGRMTPSGAVAEFPLPSASAFPVNLIAGPDGDVWFLDAVGNSDFKVGKVTPSGVVTEYALPRDTFVNGIAADAVNNDVWFTAVADRGVPSNPAITGLGRVTPDGVVTVVPGFPQQHSAALGSIVFGPGGFLWYAGGNEVGKAVLSPLTVASVRRIDRSAQRDTTIVLTFSQPLDPATAQNLGNYSLHLVQNGGVIGDPIKIDSASYDASALTVTLVVHGRLRHQGRYMLAVSGAPHTGLADQDGEPLTVAGKRGGNFLTILPRPARRLPGVR